MTPGGYQLVNFKNLSLSTDSDTIITSKSNAEILRTTNKPVYLTGMKHGATSISAPLSVADTGAYDGKVYTTPVIVENSFFYKISTDDDEIRFTPISIY